MDAIFHHSPAILCIIVAAAAYLLDPRSVLTFLSCIPLMFIIPGFYATHLAFRARSLDIIEIILISMAISSALSLTSYLLITQLLESSSYHNSYSIMIVISAILVLFVINNGNDISQIGRKRSVLASRFFQLPRKEKASLIIAILLAITLIFAGAYVLVQPRGQEFTEFYLLDEGGSAVGIPREFTTGVNETVILGIANHEGRTIQYNVEVWLVNYTNNNMTVTVNEMYFVDSLNATLNSTDVDLNSPYRRQFESPIELNIVHPGKLSLFFMLFPDRSAPLPEYPLDKNKDYSTTVEATNRVLDCINQKLQFLRLGIMVFNAESQLQVNGSEIPPGEPSMFTVNDTYDLNVRISNLEGIHVDYRLEIWLVNFTNVDMAVTVSEMYYIEAFDFSLPFTGRTNVTTSHFDINGSITFEMPGNYSIFFLLYKNEVDPLPETPMVPETNYAFTDASWRIVRCVNHEIQYLMMQTIVTV